MQVLPQEPVPGTFYLVCCRYFRKNPFRALQEELSELVKVRRDKIMAGLRGLDVTTTFLRMNNLSRSEI